MIRDLAVASRQTDANVRRTFTRAIAWEECPVSRARMVEINQTAQGLCRQPASSSWGKAYLVSRFDLDLIDNLRFRAGRLDRTG